MFKIIFRSDSLLLFHVHLSNHPMLWPSSSYGHRSPLYHCPYPLSFLLSAWPTFLLSAWHYRFPVVLLLQESSWACWRFLAKLESLRLFWFFLDTCICGFLPWRGFARPSSWALVELIHFNAVLWPQGLFGSILCISRSVFLLRYF